MTEYEALNPMQKLLIDLGTMVQAYDIAAPAEDQAKAKRLYEKVVDLLNALEPENLTVMYVLGLVMVQAIRDDLEANGELGPCLEPPPTPQQPVN